MTKEKPKENNKTRLMEIDLNLIREHSPELARRVYIIYQKYMETQYQLEEAMKIEREARSENVCLKTENEALKKEVEILRTNLSKLRMQLEEQTRRRMQLELEHKDILLRSEIVQHGFKTLLEKLDELYEKLGERYTREYTEDVRREIREDMEVITSQIKNLMETFTVPKVVSHEAKK